jgi:lichenan operon transcriptional antiterminator
MHEEQSREMRLIYHLAQADKPLTSQMLADLVSVSPRTIKSDMLRVRELLGDVGAELVSRKSLGYSIQVVDKVRFDPFFEQMLYNRMLLGNFLSDHLARSIFLARTLVSSDRYLKLDDLADAMFLSRSSIKNEMKAIASFFNSFHLQIDSKAGYGIKILGSEGNLRLAMTELVVVHYHKIKISDSSPEYARILECPEELRQQIRRNYLKTFRESGMAAIDDETLRFSFYLVVMRNRIRDGHKIVLDEDLKFELKQLVEYPLARLVIDNLRIFEGFAVDEDEICQIAMMFHCMRDMQTCDITPDMPFLSEAKTLIEEVIGRIDMQWQIDFTQHPTLRDELITICLPLLAQIRYGFSSHQSIGLNLRSYEIAGSPLAMELGRTTMRLIEEKYYCRLNTRSMIGISFRFFSAMSSIRYDIRRLNLLTVSRAGKQSAMQLISRIENRFGNMIASNTPVELYEIRGLDHSKYDCVLMNDPEFSYYYPIPFMLIDTVTQPQQFNRLFDEVLVNAYQFNHLLPDIAKARIYPQFEFEGVSAFLKLIAYKHGKDETYSNLLFEILSENEKFISYNSLGETVVLFVPFLMAKEECVEIYRLSSIGTWGPNDVQTIVFIVADIGGSRQKAKAIENISRQLIISKKMLEEMVEKPCCGIYAKMIKSCLTSE